MYKIIPQSERREYTFKQLKELFNGKWVYLILAKFNHAHGLIRATPVVVADSELEGIEEGIYEQYHNEEYGIKADADFTNMSASIPSVLWSERIE
ncbi:MAG: hypothetical protein FWH01_14670 [Oscillospiraceae bacterium]|nr:hypothetical protein [Oscillospiraceae bacterium]